MEDKSLNDRFRQAMCTIYEMFVTHRGYDRVSQVMDTPHLFMITKDNHPNASILIFLLGNEKLNIDGVKEMIQMMHNMHIQHGVLIYQNSITSSARKALELLYQFKIELFALHELQYDITKHMYYCKHEKVTHASELGPLQNQLPKLPKILPTDPIVRFFGFSKNDVLRIKRPNGNIVYRVVK